MVFLNKRSGFNMSELSITLNIAFSMMLILFIGYNILES
ncbi:hypothetical protein J2Z26_000277 [Bacillus luteolus]|nr:hypothetical protein [Cytobacillus luteolus]